MLFTICHNNFFNEVVKLIHLKTLVFIIIQVIDNNM